MFTTTVFPRAATSLAERTLPDFHSIRRVLEGFHIPCLAFDRSGLPVHTSPEAAALRASVPDADEVWTQARRLALHLLEAPGSRDSACSLIASRSLAGVALHVRLAVVGSELIAIVALRAEPVGERPQPAEVADGLTAREAEVAALIASGKSLKQVAGALGISVHTARRHCERIYQKLGIQTRAQLVLIFAQRAAPTLPRSA